MNMTSIKLKFKPSVNPEKEGSLVFQLIHKRRTCRIKSIYKVFGNEWDEASGQIILPSQGSPRYGQLNYIRFNVEWEMLRLKEITDEMEGKDGNWSLADIVKKKLCPAQIWSTACSTLSVHKFSARSSWARYVAAKPIKPL